MAKTISTQYDRYTVEFKRLAVALTLHPDIVAIDVAEHLGIHPVMLYRWRMEMKNGDLPGKDKVEDVLVETDLIKANDRIKKLEAELGKTRLEHDKTKLECDFLKKVKRFFQDKK